MGKFPSSRLVNLSINTYAVCSALWTKKTSQVTYVTMVPRVGNETLRPLGDTMGNASSVTRA